MDPFLVSNFLRNLPNQLFFLILLTRQVMRCCRNVLFVDVSSGFRQLFHMRCILDIGQNDLNLGLYMNICLGPFKNLLFLITEMISFACILKKTVNSFPSICSSNLIKVETVYLVSSRNFKSTKWKSFNQKNLPNFRTKRILLENSKKFHFHQVELQNS